MSIWDATGLGYGFAFNGKEQDNEVSGEGNTIAFEERIYDARLGRFLSSDPWEHKYAWQTTYAYFKNSPISTLDILGMGGGDDETEGSLADGDVNATPNQEPLEVLVEGEVGMTAGSITLMGKLAGVGIGYTEQFGEITMVGVDFSFGYNEDEGMVGHINFTFFDDETQEFGREANIVVGAGKTTEVSYKTKEVITETQTVNMAAVSIESSTNASTGQTTSKTSLGAGAKASVGIGAEANGSISVNRNVLTVMRPSAAASSAADQSLRDSGWGTTQQSDNAYVAPLVLPVIITK